VRIKVCGATRPADIELLAGRGVDLVGLWHGIPGGRAELPLAGLRRLAGLAHRTGRLRPVLVSFEREPAALLEAVGAAGVRWVQLHGYQPPGVIRALKARAAGVAVLKVLHVRGERCVERPLIGAYERAGVDAFVLDPVSADGRVGSTGQRLDAQVAAELVERLSRPFFLAGGIGPDSRAALGPLVSHGGFAGVDVDTGARGPDGTFDADRIADLVRAWKE
jgi:phosphoribosylanthranilate isomerase